MNVSVLFRLAILVSVAIAESMCGLLTTNVTRFQDKDKFTNPNRTAVKACHASGLGSASVDSCKKFNSFNTRAVCSSLSSCCVSCQCDTDYPSYLPHLGKCVSLSELNLDVFGQRSNGRSYKLLDL